jgi:hypothetical protein
MTQYPVLPADAPPPSVYLGDGLYADFPHGVGLIRIWANVNGQHSAPMWMGPDTLGQLLNYAAQCYVPVKGANDD